MKTLAFYLTMITLFMLAFSACKKDDTLPEINKQVQSGGLSKQESSLGTKEKFVRIAIVL
ncbi:hypothetical protein ACFLS7_00845 [Bacteroidota bacterium]